MSAPVDLYRARVRLRERTVSEAVDLALRFCVVEARRYAIVALVWLAPLAAASLAAGWGFGWAWAWAVAIPAAAAGEVAFTALASRLVFDGAVSAREMLRLALRRSPAILFVRLGTSALALLGCFATFLPGLWVATATFFLPEVLLLEGGANAGAFRRAERLAASARSEVGLGLVVLAVLPLVSVVLADTAGRAAIGALLQFSPPRSLFSEGGSALGVLGLFAQAPLRATARLFLYLDVRTRAEGWDIQTRFAAIAARAARQTQGSA